MVVTRLTQVQAYGGGMSNRDDDATVLAHIDAALQEYDTWNQTTTSPPSTGSSLLTPSAGARRADGRSCTSASSKPRPNRSTRTATPSSSPSASSAPANDVATC